jgi:hypothetical protein
MTEHESEGAVEREREMEEHERKAREHEPAERSPEGEGPADPTAANDEAPPGTAGRMSGGG